MARRVALIRMKNSLFLCNIRTGEFTSSNFPFPITSDFRLLSTCKGLAIALLHRGKPSRLVIGNPLADKWKLLPEPPLEIGEAGLARNPVDNSPELIASEYGPRCCRYDFRTEEWLKGPEHETLRVPNSNFAWHRGSFHAFFDDVHCSDDEEEEEENWEGMTPEKAEELLNPDETKFKESTRVGLYRCQVVGKEDAKWTRVELSSEVKRLLWYWGAQKILVDRDRMFLYLWSGPPYKFDPRKKRRSVHRMFEVVNNGSKVVEDLSWIKAADEFDPDGKIPVDVWDDIGYARKGDDFCWMAEKSITLHSGVDGCLSEIIRPDGCSFQMVHLEDVEDGHCDAFLDQPSPSTSQVLTIKEFLYYPYAARLDEKYLTTFLALEDINGDLTKLKYE